MMTTVVDVDLAALDAEVDEARAEVLRLNAEANAELAEWRERVADRERAGGDRSGIPKPQTPDLDGGAAARGFAEDRFQRAQRARAEAESLGRMAPHQQLDYAVKLAERDLREARRQDRVTPELEERLRAARTAYEAWWAAERRRGDERRLAEAATSREAAVSAIAEAWGRERDVERELGAARAALTELRDEFLHDPEPVDGAGGLVQRVVALRGRVAGLESAFADAHAQVDAALTSWSQGG